MIAPESGRPVVRTARTGRPTPGTPNGNAPFASRAPTVADRATVEAARGLARAWGAAGLVNGAAALTRYLQGDGGPLTVDPTGPLATRPFRLVADRHLMEWRDLALTRWWRSGGRECAFDATTNWHGVLVGPHDNLDWWLALRGLQYRMTGLVEIRPGVEAERPAVSVVHDIAIYKDWGFDKGRSEYGVSFNPLARLHEAGLAREFPVVGHRAGLHWWGPVY